MKMMLLVRFLLAAVFCLGAGPLGRAEPVYLKSGKVIQADKVEASEYYGTLKVFERERSLRPGTWQPGGSGQMQDNYRTSSYSVSDLADESIKRYFPKRWAQMQGAPNAGGQKIGGNVASDKGANVSLVGVRVKWGVVKDASVSPPREIKADFRVLEGKLMNISGNPLWHVSATLAAGDFNKQVEISGYMTKTVSVAFEIKLGRDVDLSKGDAVLTVKCDLNVAVDEDRRKTGEFKFKLKQNASGECVLAPMD